MRVSHNLSLPSSNVRSLNLIDWRKILWSGVCYYLWKKSQEGACLEIGVSSSNGCWLNMPEKNLILMMRKNDMESLEKAVELAVSKAVNEVLKAVVAGGISVGSQAVTSAEHKSAVIPEEAEAPKMGVLPEVDGDNELPTSALSFLDSF